MRHKLEDKDTFERHKHTLRGRDIELIKSIKSKAEELLELYYKICDINDVPPNFVFSGPLSYRAIESLEESVLLAVSALAKNTFKK